MHLFLFTFMKRPSIAIKCYNVGNKEKYLDNPVLGQENYSMDLV